MSKVTSYKAVMLSQSLSGDTGRTDVESFDALPGALNWLALETVKAARARRTILRAEIVRTETNRDE